MSTKHATTGMSYSPTMRRLASRARICAVADIDNLVYAKHLGRDGKRLTHTPEALDAVVLSVTALEAGVNEMAAWVRHGFATPREPLPDDFMGQRLSDKWMTIARCMTGCEF